MITHTFGSNGTAIRSQIGPTTTGRTSSTGQCLSQQRCNKCMAIVPALLLLVISSTGIPQTCMCLHPLLLKQKSMQPAASQGWCDMPSKDPAMDETLQHSAVLQNEVFCVCRQVMMESHAHLLAWVTSTRQVHQQSSSKQQNCQNMESKREFVCQALQQKDE